MSRVVFWSLDKGMTGNTYSTIAISTLMSITHKTSSLLIQGNYNSRTIEAFFAPIAFFIPISRRRSFTPAIMVVITFIPETRSEIPAIRESMIFIVEVMLSS